MKKIICLLISGVLIAATVPAETSYALQAKPTSTAATISILPKEPEGPSEAPSKDALEKAIKAVKAKVTIPTEYSDFNYYFYNTSTYLDSYWSLTWKNPKDNSFIQVDCDQENHITNYRKESVDKKDNSLPVYRKKELKDKADDFIKKITPEIPSKLKYINADFDGVYSGNYIYNYERIENGISFPENTVKITVNSVNGEVTDASVNWLYNVSIPSSDVKISKDEASRLIAKNMDMKLTYHSNIYPFYDRNMTSNNKVSLFYEPSQNYISVDAKTGKVYLAKNEWRENKSKNEATDTAAAKSTANVIARGDIALTEEEIAKIEELKKLISKEKAIKIITSNKKLYIDKNLTSFSATLDKSENRNNNPDDYVWNIQLSDPRPVSKKKNADTYRAYANAEVDAKTGNIISFYANVKNTYDGNNGKWKNIKIKYDKKDCRTRLENFLKTQMNNRFASTKLSDTNEDYIIYYKGNTPVFGGYNYRYNRVNQEVEYPYNSIFGAVDGVTGKIYNFYYNWDDNIVFESKAGAITPAQAMNDYLSKDGYNLVYEINVINQLDKKDAVASRKVEYEVRLVYHPDINPYYISPFTGEQLSYDGEVYKKSQPISYLDVDDTAENKEILLLADMNIGFDGQYFYPKKEVTNGELVEMMKKVGYGYDEADAANKDNKITRQELAKNFIKQLGLENASEIKGIYKTGYNDEANIGQDYLGAVAIAKGLGIMQGDSNNNFNANAYVTRAEAVHIVLCFIKAQQAMIYN